MNSHLQVWIVMVAAGFPLWLLEAIDTARWIDVAWIGAAAMLSHYIHPSEQRKREER